MPCSENKSRRGIKKVLYLVKSLLRKRERYPKAQFTLFLEFRTEHRSYKVKVIVCQWNTKLYGISYSPLYPSKKLVFWALQCDKLYYDDCQVCISVCVLFLFEAVTWPHMSLCAQMSAGTQHNYTSSYPDLMSLTKRHHPLPKFMFNFISSFRPRARAYLNIRTFCLSMWNHSLLSLLWKTSQFKPCFLQL